MGPASPAAALVPGAMRQNDRPPRDDLPCSPSQPVPRAPRRPAMSRFAATLLALAATLLLALPPAAALAADDLTATVTAMARIGRVSSPHFSPDGERIAFISDLSGVPQVWVMPAAGGYPEAVTTFDDPVIAL